MVIFLCFETFLVSKQSWSYYNWNSLSKNLYVKNLKLKKCIVLLGWNNSATTNWPVPYIIDSNMINAHRCNCYKCWCQNECMNHANGYNCFKATLKCNFFTVQKCSPKQIKNEFWDSKQKFHIPKQCIWHIRSKQLHSQYAHQIV